MSNVYNIKSCKSAIFSSKLYQSSTRKDKIRATMDDPINAELIEQLDEYIGDEYKIPEDTSQNVLKKSDNPNDKPDIDNNGGAVQHGQPMPVKHSIDHVSPDNHEDSDESDDQTDDVQAENEGDINDTMNSSTTVNKPYIAADTVVTKPLVETQISLSGLAGEIKGTLNARSATSGVARTSVKNDELWVYYNDDINLNNVMSPVIETISAANYHYLIFNRLARTDNAIVFAINGNDTLNTIGSTTDE